MNASDKTPVAIALSGGTDSAAAAVMMKRSGFELLALTMLLSSGADGNDSSIRAAGAIAGRLGIRHRVLDLREQFEELVIRALFLRLLEGAHAEPVRDMQPGTQGRAHAESRARCGLRVDGDRPLRYLAPWKATGAVWCCAPGTGRRTRATSSGRSTGPTSGDWCSRSAGKPGSEARDIVRGEGLDSLTVTESQDICFLAGGHYREAFVLHAPDALMPGPILDVDGRVLGSHRGLPLYTVGQRRGLGLGGARALYVLELRPEDNSIVVGGPEELACTRFEVTGVNFTADEPGTSFDVRGHDQVPGGCAPRVVELAGGGERTCGTGSPAHRRRPASPPCSTMAIRCSGEA